MMSAKQRSSLEDFSKPHLTPPSASTDKRGDWVRRGSEMKIETPQNPAIFHDGPPSSTLDAQAMQEGV